ncbi:DUF2312 domain-containing protein [Bradyrhizobium neotropicale]|nr:DUF2312 domain-containing protein [Bradyrhizobium neotropicale]
MGHNSAISKEASDRLKSIIDRIENIEEERKGLGDDIKDIKKEAKAAGYDMAAIGTILKMRKKSAQEVLDSTMVVETYCRALGMRSYLE